MASSAATDISCDRLWIGARLATLAPHRPGLGIVERGAVAVKDGRIVYAGNEDELPSMYRGARETIRCEGRWITPGLIDCHTHIVHAGNRAAEFEMRLRGASYEEVARAGGGIVSSVRSLRAASEGELLRQTLPRLDALMSEGKILPSHHEGVRVYVLSRHDNPLVGGCSKEAISENIRRELHAHPEMPVAQGVAIAYSHARSEGCHLPKRRRANPATDTAVADVILEQLGGMRRLSMMVGARHFVALEHGVQFSIGSGAKSGINKVRVVLQPSDTYDVEFWKVRGTTMKKISEWGDVYNNQLMDLFEKETGMYLTIKPRRDNPAREDNCAPCAMAGAL